MALKDQYEIGELLGKGSYSEVRLATNLSTGKIYAAKIPKKLTDIDQMAILEISSLRMLENASNIVTIKDLVYDNNKINPIIILYLYNGTVNERPPKTPEALRHMIFDTCNGLLSLYNKSIYHLDIKPGNILYSDNPDYGSYGRYMISDFGFSIKVITESNVFHNCNVQTPAYAAPEIMASVLSGIGCKYDYTVDLWSIGIIIGELAIKMVNHDSKHPIQMDLPTIKQRRGKKELYHFLLTGIFKVFGRGSITKFLDRELTEILPNEISTYDTRSLFSNMSDIEYDFMMILLKLNPKDRPSYRIIFSHPYFNGFTAREPFDMTPLEKVKSMDKIHIDDPINTNRLLILDFMHDIIESNNINESYFLAITISDFYITKRTDVNNWKLIAIAALIISSYVNEYHPLEMKNFISKKISIFNIHTTIAEMLDIFEYNLFFSTEKDYLDAELNLRTSSPHHHHHIEEYTDYRDSALVLLTKASRSRYFRSYNKETIAHTIVSKIFGEGDEYSDVYDKLGI